MTQSHTPTPYIYLDAYHGIYDMPDARGAQVRIAEIVRTSDYEANAAFIVRACNEYYQNKQTIDDLVKALDTIVKASETYGMGVMNGEAKLCKQYSDLAKAALAKAKGGAA